MAYLMGAGLLGLAAITPWRWLAIIVYVLALVEFALAAILWREN